jgi:hypothetical protein
MVSFSLRLRYVTEFEYIRILPAGEREDLYMSDDPHVELKMGRLAKDAAGSKILATIVIATGGNFEAAELMGVH